MNIDALDIDELLAQALQADPALRDRIDDATAWQLLTSAFAAVRATVDALGEQPVKVEGLGLFRHRIKGQKGKLSDRRWVLFETQQGPVASPHRVPRVPSAPFALPAPEQFPALQFILPPLAGGEAHAEAQQPTDSTLDDPAPPSAADAVPPSPLDPAANPQATPASADASSWPGEPAGAAQIVWPQIPVDAAPHAEPPEPVQAEPAEAADAAEAAEAADAALPALPVLQPADLLPPEPAQPMQAWVSAYLAPERPLLDPDHQLMLVYSRLAASTPAVLWFLQRMGIAPPPHARREKPQAGLEAGLFRRPDVVAALQVPPHAWTLVRVVRDPLERAVSGFRQALATGYVRAAMLDTLGIDIDRSGLSFQQYIDFLESEDLDRCHPMHRRQMHPVERLRTPDFLINVSRQDLSEQLSEVESKLGLVPTDWAALRRHEAPRAKLRGRMAPSLSKPDEVRLTRHQAQHGPWPTHLLTQRAVSWLKDLYAEDVSAYGAPARDADGAPHDRADAERTAPAH
jgi:hypothetical protein